VKPSNLVLGDARKVKILDLGLATLLQPDARDGFQTEAGIAVGTMEYISPEQACHKRVDGRSDIYSLGCVMYHLVTGRLPFAGDSSMERLAVRITGHCVPITEVVPGLHPGVVRAVEKMMARRPEDRFQTAGEVAKVLCNLIRRKHGPRTASAPAVPPTIE
jgi:serine/threonine-protein kinase